MGEQFAKRQIYTDVLGETFKEAGRVAFICILHLKEECDGCGLCEREPEDEGGEDA